MKLSEVALDNNEILKKTVEHLTTEHQANCDYGEVEWVSPDMVRLVANDRAGNSALLEIKALKHLKRLFMSMTMFDEQLNLSSLHASSDAVRQVKPKRVLTDYNNTTTIDTELNFLFIAEEIDSAVGLFIGVGGMEPE